jgi:hypothetical protein
MHLGSIIVMRETIVSVECTYLKPLDVAEVIKSVSHKNPTWKREKPMHPHMWQTSVRWSSIEQVKNSYNLWEQYLGKTLDINVHRQNLEPTKIRQRLRVEIISGFTKKAKLDTHVRSWP